VHVFIGRYIVNPLKAPAVFVTGLIAQGTKSRDYAFVGVIHKNPPIFLQKFPGANISGRASYSIQREWAGIKWLEGRFTIDNLDCYLTRQNCKQKVISIEYFLCPGHYNPQVFFGHVSMHTQEFYKSFNHLWR